VAGQLGDPDSFLTLYRQALQLRRTHPALGFGESDGQDGHRMQWLDGPDGTLFFSREPGFVFAANTSPAEVTLPPHSKVLLSSGPIEDGKLPPDTAAWLAI
jgi:alpha-glucosidase